MPAARAAFAGARTLFHIRGVPVRVDWSLLFMALLVVSTSVSRFESGLGDLGTPVVVLASVAYALGFFGSILIHELGHTFANLDRGIPVTGITLFALGGVTESTREAERPGDEFVIVGIGPFLSLVLAALFGLISAAVGALRPVAMVAGILGWTNLALAVFNVLPGYPLDGGRLLRSILWKVSGQPHRATRWAARVGQAFGIALIAWGLSGILGVGPVLRVGRVAFGADLWEVLIGFFLLRGASAAYSQAELRERLAARTVRQLMGSVPSTLPAELPLAEAVRAVQTRPSVLWPVGVPLVGAVNLERFDGVPGDRWQSTPVGAIAYPAQDVTVRADQPLDDVLERLADAPGAMLLVVDGDRVVGLLTPSLVTDVA
jgi:Zn-dependent protease